MTDVRNSLLAKNSRDQEEDKETDEVESRMKPEAVLVKEDLTIVKGIGKTVAEKLYQAGITSVHELALVSKEQLMRIKGIGSETATRFITAAKSSIKVPTLNTFTGSSPIIKPSVQENLIEENNRQVVTSNINEKWFDDKFKKPKPGVWYSPQGQEISKRDPSTQVPPRTKDDDEESVEIEGESDDDQIHDIAKDTSLRKSNYQNNENQPKLPSPTMESPAHIETRPHDDIIEKRKVSTLNSQKVTSIELNDMKAAVQEELTSSGYYLIHHNPFLDNIFQGVDLLGVKLIQVNEFLDLLLLIPVKINSLKGPLIVSEDSVEYNFSQEEGSRFNRTITTLHKADLDKIVQSQEAIFKELVSEGKLFQFFQKYLKLNISVEKTITSKRLFFRAGALQYKILIEPVLINQGEVGLIEKVLPFAYQKSSNLHIIQRNDLSELLPYLEQKYYLIETQQEQETSITKYFKASNSLMKELRLYSIPFIGFGIILAFILLSQVPELILVFMNVGFGLIIIYSVVVGYLYYKFYNKKRIIQEEFRTPYYQQSPELDETSLILINEELSPELMAQFSYECLGKNIPFPLISQLEHNRAEELRTNRDGPVEIEREEFFEPPSAPQESDLKMKDKLNSKFSSFLED